MHPHCAKRTMTPVQHWGCTTLGKEPGCSLRRLLYPPPLATDLGTSQELPDPLGVDDGTNTGDVLIETGTGAGTGLAAPGEALGSSTGRITEAGACTWAWS
jgi:hypothetical protein